MGTGEAKCVLAQVADDTTSNLIPVSSATNSAVSSTSSTADVRNTESHRAYLPVGLGVGIPLALIFIGALVLFRMRMLSRRKKETAAEATQERFEKAELSGLSSVNLTELPETGYYELEAYETPRELIGTEEGLLHELSGPQTSITKNNKRSA
ncbi:hypothetical protein O1611_g5535 [Lasiodiplodia mahajangana]|uniref:Uncharacterized protein n=1 Tax=Lasiodiplodia mahajangana TaxID=1108764 RepID=A0ACC2JKX5_9PEZI|nr:hypothetical protein O1611_g5535 [Lasiodiplodia mahajangana]